MIRTEVPGIDSGEIMARVDAILQRDQADRNMQSQGASASCRTLAFLHMPEPTTIDLIRESYHVGEFLARHDADFVHNAFLGLLRRAPEDDELSRCLDELRSGRKSKAEILGRLRYCEEGRHIGIKVKGLFRTWLLKRSYSIPLLGYGIRLVVGVIRLPAHLRHLKQIENFMHARFQDYAQHFNQACEPIVARVNELEGTVIRELRRSAQSPEGKTGTAGALCSEGKESVSLGEEIPEPPAHIPLDALYADFEENFRGSPEALRKQMLPFLAYIQQARAGTPQAPVFDIGCGRGEWLELLRENEFCAQGIDQNEALVKACRERGLDVVLGDALSRMRSLPSESLGAVTGFHIIEHLAFETLVILVDEIFRVLRPGGIVLFATPNPENLIVGACTFYLDPTHRAPVHPATLRFLLEHRGFHGSSVKGINPAGADQTDDPLLQRLFFGPQDYLGFAWKQRAPQTAEPGA